MNLEKDRQKVVEWAKQKLANRSQWVVLDTETTGLGDREIAEIVEIAIIDGFGKPLLNSRVKPKTAKVEPGALKAHRISDSDLATAPGFGGIYSLIEQAIKSKMVLIYNAAFDTRILADCCRVNDLPFLDFCSECVMLPYSEWVGEWNEYYGNYRWQKLPGGDHSALGECLATLECLETMAGWNQQLSLEKFPF